MKLLKRMVMLSGAFAFAITLSSVYVAQAHVTVKPSETLTASYQTFTVSVPNEKSIPTTKIKLLIPDQIQTITVTNKPAWNVEIEKDGEKVKSVTWSNSEIKDGFRDEFTFSAKTPDADTNLEWKAYQTYSDGTVVAWDKSSNNADKSHGSSNEGPFSVTKVSNQSNENVKSEDDNIASQRAMYVAVAGVFIGLVAIYLSTRSNNKN